MAEAQPQHSGEPRGSGAAAMAEDSSEPPKTTAGQRVGSRQYNHFMVGQPPRPITPDSPPGSNMPRQPFCSACLGAATTARAPARSRQKAAPWGQPAARLPAANSLPGAAGVRQSVRVPGQVHADQAHRQGRLRGRLVSSLSLLRLVRLSYGLFRSPTSVVPAQGGQVATPFRCPGLH